MASKLLESEKYPHKNAVHIYDSGLGQYRVATNEDLGGGPGTSQIQLLEAISGNTASINLNVDTLEVNTDQLEDAIQTGNALIESGNLLIESGNKVLRDIESNTDQIEDGIQTGNNLIESGNEVLRGIKSNTDQLEDGIQTGNALIESGNQVLRDIESNTDQIENAIQTGNNLTESGNQVLRDIESNTDQIEDAIQTGNNLIESGNKVLRDIESNTDQIEDGIQTGNALIESGNQVLRDIDVNTDQLDGYLDSGIQRTGDSFNGEVVVAGGLARSGVPIQHEDGDVVAPWHDDLGRQVIKGFDVAQDVLKVEEQAPALTQIGEQTLLNAVTSDGAGTVIEVDIYNKNTFYVQATNVTSGTHLRIETSADDSTYIIEHDENILKNDNFTIGLSEEKHKYIRPLVTGYIDGTYSVKWIGGN